jgi:5-methylcytosine-specific restriction endonuclease McrA
MLSQETRRKISLKATEKRNSKSWDELSKKQKKNILREESNFTCQRCGFDKRRIDGTSILEIDHIDGNTLNYSKENLIVLCPNCHALTMTFLNKRGKGKSNLRYSEKWSEILEKNKRFVSTVKDSFESNTINYTQSNWPNELKKLLKGTYKEELIILRMRKLLPKFYSTKCYNVMNEQDLFDSKLQSDEYSFF